MADELTTGTSGTGGSTDVGAGAAGSAGAATTPIALTDTSAFIPPGSKEPVTWKDFSSGHVSKAELTRMRQEDAARQASERQTWQQTERQKLQQEFQQQQQRQQTTAQTSQQTAAFLNNLRGLQYLSGEQAAGLVEQTIIPMAAALPKLREEYANGFKFVMDQIQAIQKSLGTVTTKSAEGEFSNLLTSTRAKLNLPDQPIIHELLQDVYHSHTGWETDPEAFERTVADRWKALQAVIRGADRQQADEARRVRVPGAPVTGGAAKPGRPLVKGNESAEALADRLWTGLQPVNT